jgi:uncharacterized protein (DUF302 family)/ketosteroid isomerase-like protein
MMPNPTSTADVLDRFLKALGRGDASSVEALFADAIDWYVGGNPALPWTGTRTRRSDVATYFHTLWSHLTPGESSSVVEHIVVSGDDAVVFAVFKNTAKATGVTFETPVALHLGVAAGVIVKLHLYEDTWMVSNAFGADERERASGLVTLVSRYNFSESIERLTKAIASAGAVLFATIDQQAAAAMAGLVLRPTTMLIFGSPRVGTAIMQAFPIAALDLPLKILVWEENDVVHVAYARVRDFSDAGTMANADASLVATDRALETLTKSIL